MRIERIRKVYPGSVITEKGFKCHGIVDDRAVIIGTLCKVEDLYFVMSKTSAYVPKKYDLVIGKIVAVTAAYYKVDLGTCSGILPVMAFINASKKNRPQLERNEIVLCQISRVSDGDALLSCEKKGLGKIDECFPVASWKIRLFYFNGFLQRLSKNRNFEIALGINGYVWIGGDVKTRQEILTEIENYSTGQPSGHPIRVGHGHASNS